MYRFNLRVFPAAYPTFYLHVPFWSTTRHVQWRVWKCMEIYHSAPIEVLLQYSLWAGALSWLARSHPPPLAGRGNGHGGIVTNRKIPIGSRFSRLGDSRLICQHAKFSFESDARQDAYQSSRLRRASISRLLTAVKVRPMKTVEASVLAEPSMRTKSLSQGRHREMTQPVALVSGWHIS